MPTVYEWIVSDSIKVIVSVTQAVYAALQVTSPTKALPKRRLHWIGLWNAGVMCGLFIDMHGRVYGWEAYLVFANVTIASLVSTAIYIAHVLYEAAHQSAMLGTVAGSTVVSHNPKIYGAVLFGFVGSTLASTVLTLLKGRFVWTAIRSLGQALAVALIGPYIIMSFVKLKYQLRDLQTQHLKQQRNRRESSALERHYGAVAAHIHRMIAASCSIASLALFSAGYLGWAALVSTSTYEEELRAENKSYNFATDLIYFVSLAANAYFLYYSAVRTRPCCIYGAYTRSRSTNVNIFASSKSSINNRRGSRCSRSGKLRSLRILRAYTHTSASPTVPQNSVAVVHASPAGATDSHMSLTSQQTRSPAMRGTPTGLRRPAVELSPRALFRGGQGGKISSRGPYSRTSAEGASPRSSTLGGSHRKAPWHSPARDLKVTSRLHVLRKASGVTSDAEGSSDGDLKSEKTGSATSMQVAVAVSLTTMDGSKAGLGSDSRGSNGADTKSGESESARSGSARARATPVAISQPPGLSPRALVRASGSDTATTFAPSVEGAVINL